MTKISEDEQKFIKFLLNKKISAPEEKILEDFKGCEPFSLAPHNENYFKTMITKRQYEKNQELIEDLKNKFLSIKVKIDSKIFESHEPILHCSEYTTMDMNTLITNTRYIMRIILDVINNFKQECLSLEDRNRSLEKAIMESF